MNHLYFISILLNQTLVHRGRNAAVGVNPIPPKLDGVSTLVVDDKERGGDSLASHGQIHIKDALCL
jgi:hypothetical protein